jgi:hypothetical protein
LPILVRIHDINPRFIFLTLTYAPQANPKSISGEVDENVIELREPAMPDSGCQSLQGFVHASDQEGQTGDDEKVFGENRLDPNC